MDRTLLSINFPNALSIGVMGFGIWLGAGLLWQLYQHLTNKGA